MTTDTNRYLGYPDRLSVPAGERIEFRLSSEQPSVKVEVLRLRCADVDANGPGFKYDLVASAIDGVHPCADQPIRPGSCAVIPHDGALTARADGWSFGAFVHPTLVGETAKAIMGVWRAETECGYALEIDPDGRPALLLGARRFTLAAAVSLHTWSFVGASFSLEAGTATVSLITPPDGTRPERSFVETFAIEGDVLVASEPDFLIAAYPTRGLDIGAANFVYEMLNRAKERGIGILFVGEDLDVLMNLCDRISVLHAGRLMGTVNAGTVTKEKLGLLMTGSGGEEAHA